MAYCPGCTAELPADAARCASCNAVFGEGSSWAPLAQRPVPPPPSGLRRFFIVVAKVVLVAISGAFLLLGGTVAHVEKGSQWYVACAMAMLGVLAVAFLARLRWSLLATLAAVALGFTSCAANFKWHGG